jgi:drug/metabolite transporter (DMT)-like permease
VQQQNRALSFLLISILALIWGSSFILMKRGLVVYSPVQIGCIRIGAAFLAMLPFVFISYKKVSRSQWKYLAAAGILGNGIPSMLFPLAQTHISSTLAGMLNSLTPLFVYLVGTTLFGMHSSRSRMLGLLLGMIGAITLVASRGSGAAENDYLYSLFIVAATLCYAFSVNILRYKLTSLDPITTTSFALFFVGIPMGSFLFTTGFLSRTADMAGLPAGQAGSHFALTCIILLGVFGTALSTVIFNKLIKVSDALFASSVTYLIPIVATLWGIFDNEHLGISHALGLGAILSGVYLINKQK